MNIIKPHLKTNRNARIHEAGHVVVAKHLGYGARWGITKAGSKEEVWEGFAAIGKISDPNHAKAIALAGPLAEMIIGETPYDEPLSDLAIVGALRTGTYALSPADAELAGDCTQQDVLEVCKLVRELRLRIEEEADRTNKGTK